MADLAPRTINKVMWRLLPFLMACYFVAFLDRVNVGFAHLQMSKSLGMSEAAFGFGAGVFFIGYFLLEVPSNILMERLGARVWIARIMLSWGVVSTSFGFIPQISGYTGLSPDVCFYLLRFLLGLCEAGFYPGVVYYLTRWFPSAYRARMIAFFMLAVPVSSVIGAPLSGLLLNVTGLGMEGWQWMYILEGMPSVLLSIAVYFYLTDYPPNAKWLQKDEINWLVDKIAQEQVLVANIAHSGFLKMMFDIRILMCAFANFSMQGATYSITLFLPALITQLGYSNTQTGFILAFPSFHRCDRHGSVQPAFRPHGGTQVSCCRRTADAGCRDHGWRVASRPGDQAAVLHTRKYRFGIVGPDALPDPGIVPVPRNCGCRDRRGQLARGPRRLLRALPVWLYEDPDRRPNHKLTTDGQPCPDRRARRRIVAGPQYADRSWGPMIYIEDYEDGDKAW